MLNENLKAARKACGLSQEELASQLHVVRQTVSKWEQGLSVPDADMLICLADVLNTSVTALLGNSSSPSLPQENEAAVLAQKLEALTLQLAQQNEKRRRFWRAVAALLAGISIFGFAYSGLHLLYGHYANRRFGPLTAGIIGGADGPTAILVSSTSQWGMTLAAALLAAAASAFVFYKTRRK